MKTTFFVFFLVIRPCKTFKFSLLLRLSPCFLGHVNTFVFLSTIKGYCLSSKSLMLSCFFLRMVENEDDVFVKTVVCSGCRTAFDS